MICEMCNDEHDGSYGSGRFCSAKCARQFSSKKLVKKTKIVQCVTCGIDLEVDNRASNKMCKCDICRKHKKKKRETINCLVCGNPLKLNAKKFCSVTCSHKYISEQYISDWKNGLVDGNIGKYKDTLSKTIRRYLFEKYDHKCARCSWNEINSHTGKIPLQVDHIDGNHKNSTEDNLILLCPNCHSLTKTFGGSNKGNGRKNRRKSSIISEYLIDNKNKE